MGKFWQIAVIITLLTACLLLASCSREAENIIGEDIHLKVMSYNIHSGSDKDNVYNIERIANVIRESKAEVVGLQEVDAHWGNRSLFENDVKLLAEKLEMNDFFAPIYDLPPKKTGDPNRQFGVAVLSKYPVLDARNREITRLSTQVSNPTPEIAPGFAEVLLDVRGVKVKVYSTHLDYRSDPTVRNMQVKEMMKIISENEYEKIVLGDFNAKPAAPELAPLFSVLRDTWVDDRPEPGFTYPAAKPNQKIDYVLVTPGILTLSAEIINTQASDHRPILADVKLPHK